MEVFVLDTNLQTVDIIDTFESLIWTDRYSKCGDFEIYTYASLENITLFKDDYYLWTKDSEHVMIVESKQIESDVETGAHLTVTGRSLEIILARRIIWNQTVLSGNLQDGVKRLLDENVISPSDPDRRIDNFIFEPSTDEAITSLTLNAQYTGDDLYEVICQICDANNIGFKITLTDDKKFKFKLYSGSDRSYDQVKNPYVVFSPNFENIINSNYYESKKDFKNVTLVAGEGEGSARITATVGSGSGVARREMYTDARDISTTDGDTTISSDVYSQLLSERGNEKLSENVFVKAFEGEMETTQMFVYGTDFFMGDIVQIHNEYGMEAKSRVIEIVKSQSNDEYTTYPTFSVIE